uniref:Uncharacterized protein n=1 Tax=Anguilla anguilla TaxID=7936 RepID=A0A0E9W4N5_ANGAN
MVKVVIASLLHVPLLPHKILPLVRTVLLAACNSNIFYFGLVLLLTLPVLQPMPLLFLPL